MAQILLLLVGTTLVQADSVYSSPAVRAIVERAAESNREVPAALRSYGARIESEAALVLHTAEGQEMTGQVEQIASRAEWRHDGSFNQHIIGYRAQTAGPNVSAITYLERGWTLPVLYGEHMLLAGPDESPDGPGAPDQPGKTEPGDPPAPPDPDAVRGPDEADEPEDPDADPRRREAIHPFSEGRDAIYRFEGGDTVAVLQLPERTVRVVRLRVTPRRAPEETALVFHGDIDLDADRHEIVRMRGRLAWFGPQREIKPDPAPMARETTCACSSFLPGIFARDSTWSPP
jgi:hypothetical protein